MKPVVPRSFRCPESGDLCTDGNCTQTLCRAETRALARMSSQVTLISSSARDLLAASFLERPPFKCAGAERRVGPRAVVANQIHSGAWSRLTAGFIEAA